MSSGLSGDNIVTLKDANEVPLAALAKDATFRSKGYDVGRSDKFGVEVEVAGSAGTSPTVTVTVDISFDNGTTWQPYPVGVNSATQAALAAIAGNGNEWEIWDTLVPSGALVSFLFTFGGTSPSGNVTARLIQKRTRVAEV